MGVAFFNFDQQHKIIVIFAMHTFLLRVGMVGSNCLETVERVRQILKESLQTDFENSSRVVKERMDKQLVDIFGEGLYHLLVFPDKNSFFINIMVKGKRHILLTAEYKELKTLRDFAANVVAKSFKDEKEVGKLEGEVPSCLLEDIKQFL